MKLTCVSKSIAGQGLVGVSFVDKSGHPGQPSGNLNIVINKADEGKYKLEAEYEIDPKEVPGQ